MIFWLRLGLRSWIFRVLNGFYILLYCLLEIEFFYKFFRFIINEELVNLIVESFCIEISFDDGNKKKGEIILN